jgi:uncharacterized membrane protein YphA (DoxX/SURF4 family)
MVGVETADAGSPRKRFVMRVLSFSFLRSLREAGPTVLRVITGLVMAVHGWQKITNGVDGFAGFLEQLALPAPMVLAYVVTVLEFGGGLLLLAGLLSRLVGLLLAIHMLFTSFVVKVGKLDVPLIADQGTGWELDIVLFAAFVAIVLLGPGSLSLDAAVGIEQREAGRAPGDRRTPLRS